MAGLEQEEEMGDGRVGARGGDEEIRRLGCQ